MPEVLFPFGSRFHKVPRTTYYIIIMISVAYVIPSKLDRSKANA